MREPPILDFVLKKLNDEGTNLAAVCRETGMKSSWLWQLKDGRIEHPSVRRIQVLADHFGYQPAAQPQEAQA